MGEGQELVRHTSYKERKETQKPKCISIFSPSFACKFQPCFHVTLTHDMLLVFHYYYSPASSQLLPISLSSSLSPLFSSTASLLLPPPVHPSATISSPTPRHPCSPPFPQLQWIEVSNSGPRCQTTNTPSNQMKTKHSTTRSPITSPTPLLQQQEQQQQHAYSNKTMWESSPPLFSTLY